MGRFDLTPKPRTVSFRMWSASLNRAEDSRTEFTRHDPILPHSLDAERSVLGAVILDEGALGIIQERLCVHDFMLPQHRVIFRCMIKLVEDRRPIDSVTLFEKLGQNGELEAAGGVDYLSQLADGLPRVTHVRHYAQIVREKSELRELAYTGQIITQSALESGANAESISARLRELLQSQHTNSHRLQVVSAAELVAREIKPREMILSPILPTQGLAMIYSKRGVGKTWLGLGIAYAVATGSAFLGWEAPKTRRVLFVDGELPATTLQSRLKEIISTSEQRNEQLPTDTLRLVTPDFQNGAMPDIARSSGQLLIEGLLDSTELLILDNLSALCRSGKENEGESWLPVQEWALRLRQQGISVLFVHHAGKGGAQRGTSRREDVLDLVIALRHPSEYSPTDGLRCEIHFEKCRSLLGEQAKPFEVRLQNNADGHLTWTTRAVEDVIGSRAAELFGDGLSVRDVAEELGISKSSAHRLKHKTPKSGGFG